MMPVQVACGIRTCWTFVKPSAWRPWSSIWAWSWDPLKFMRRHPPHHLSPPGQVTGQGQIPKRASAAPSHHSNAPIKPESQSFLSKIVAHCANERTETREVKD